MIEGKYTCFYLARVMFVCFSLLDGVVIFLGFPGDSEVRICLPVQEIYIHTYTYMYICVHIHIHTPSTATESSEILR